MRGELLDFDDVRDVVLAEDIDESPVSVEAHGSLAFAWSLERFVVQPGAFLHLAQTVLGDLGDPGEHLVLDMLWQLGELLLRGLGHADVADEHAFCPFLNKPYRHSKVNLKGDTLASPR